MLKTPPERAGAVEASVEAETAGADDAWVAGGEVVAGALPVADGAAPDAPATAAAHEPVGVDKAEEVCKPSCSRDPPGFGKIRSVSDMVPHPLPIFAVNISGRALKAVWSRSTSWVTLRAMTSSSSALRLAEPDVMVTGAQFMYISRLPTLLNQVHAKVAVPVGRLVGTVKE